MILNRFQINLMKQKQVKILTNRIFKTQLTIFGLTLFYIDFFKTKHHIRNWNLLINFLCVHFYLAW
jgi:hypothetical protein